MKKNIIAVFDIGKTNKKVILFDEQLQVVFEREQIFPGLKDDDGFECDDIDALEKWMHETLEHLLHHRDYDLKALNFTTYGATLVYLDSEGKRLTPVYNYLKPMPEGIVEPLYEAYGGEDEFSRITASPALGMLNSGLQILWLKKKKPDVYEKVKEILHFPQYLSYLFTGNICSEYTSIGCHTAMWDFDHMQYHPWLGDHGIDLPEPIPNDTLYSTKVSGKRIEIGIGIHDSSASLVPYIKGNNSKFILASTGTWIINMNPFNHEPLTRQQLEEDCLCNLSVNQERVKSSRFFMGHIHDVNVEMLASHYSVPADHYKNIKADISLLNSMEYGLDSPMIFFKDGVPPGYKDNSVDPAQFPSYDEAYHKLMVDLTRMSNHSLDLVLAEDDESKDIFISGGFACNEAFVRLTATRYSEKSVYTSEVKNASALGAAIMVWKAISSGQLPDQDLGLRLWQPVTS